MDGRFRIYLFPKTKNTPESDQTKMYALRETIRQSFEDTLVARKEARIRSSTHASLANYVIHLSEVEHPFRPYDMPRLTNVALTSFEKTVGAMRCAPEVFREFLVPRQPTFEQAVQFVMALETRLPDAAEEVTGKKRKLPLNERCQTPPRKQPCAPGWYCA